MRKHVVPRWRQLTSWSETGGPDTAGSVLLRAYRASDENTRRTRRRSGGRFLQYDGSNYVAGVLPAFFGVVGSQGPPFFCDPTYFLLQSLSNCRPSNTRSVRRASGFVQIAIALTDQRSKREMAC